MVIVEKKLAFLRSFGKIRKNKLKSPGKITQPKIHAQKNAFATEINFRKNSKSATKSHWA